MELTTTQRRELLRKISVARKALTDLEEELGPTAPAPRRVDAYKEHFENTSALGIWRKPAHLKKQKGL